MPNWKTNPFTRGGVTGLNGRCVAQLNSIKNVGHILPLPFAQYVAKQARGYAHVITGEMRDKTVAETVDETSARVVSTSDHAAHEEFGTRFRPAHPFVRPAIADAKRNVPKMSATDVNREIRRRVKSA